MGFLKFLIGDRCGHFLGNLLKHIRDNHRMFTCVPLFRGFAIACNGLESVPHLLLILDIWTGLLNDVPTLPLSVITRLHFSAEAFGDTLNSGLLIDAVLGLPRGIKAIPVGLPIIGLRCDGDRIGVDRLSLVGSTASSGPGSPLP
jgi:hypothetical protein